MALPQDRGHAAEALAAAYLVLLGFRTRATNVRLAGVEVDVVAEHEGTTVLVEVKLRTRSDYGGATHAVDRAQRARLGRAVLAMQQRERRPVRLDVVAVDLDEDEARLRHIRNVRFDD